jgi:hypothetical protein
MREPFYEPLNMNSHCIVAHEQIGLLNSEEGIHNCGEVAMTDVPDE